MHNRLLLYLVNENVCRVDPGVRSGMMDANVRFPKHRQINK